VKKPAPRTTKVNIDAIMTKAIKTIAASRPVNPSGVELFRRDILEFLADPRCLPHQNLYNLFVGGILYII
jgi:hypothetical protein